MKQSEKLDYVLRSLYEYRYKGKYLSIGDILYKVDEQITWDEVFSLTKRLEKDGMVKTIHTRMAAHGMLTSEGVDYCENDSYENKGTAITSINVTGSSNVTIINNSKDILLYNDSKKQDILKILEDIQVTLLAEKELSEDFKEEVVECLTDIQDKVAQNKPVTKYSFKSLLEYSSKASSIGSFVINLGKVLSLFPK